VRRLREYGLTFAWFLGTLFGYAHLFVVLCAGIFAILLQVLAARLGIVTGADLAQHLRTRLHDRPKHKLFYRWVGLYGLYVMYELAIIATDVSLKLHSWAI
jgi:metal iron transporter